jgi:hypothetical protein
MLCNIYKENSLKATSKKKLNNFFIIIFLLKKFINVCHLIKTN